MHIYTVSESTAPAVQAPAIAPPCHGGFCNKFTNQKKLAVWTRWAETPKQKTSNSIFEVLYILIKIKISSDLIRHPINIYYIQVVVKPPQRKKTCWSGQIEAFPLHLQGETSLLFESTSIQSHLLPNLLMLNTKKTCNIPLYWFFNRDPYTGLLLSGQNWVVYSGIYPKQQVFLIVQLL